MKSSPLELYWVYPLVLWRVAHVATPTKPPAGDIFTAPRSGIGLVCGFAATDSRLYYNRVTLVINFGYTQDSRRDAQPQLSVPATVLRFSFNKPN